MSYLILSRFVDESIVLYDRQFPERVIARILVSSVKGRKVRLGIQAGPEIGAHRDEVYSRMLHELGDDLGGEG